MRRVDRHEGEAHRDELVSRGRLLRRTAAAAAASGVVVGLLSLPSQAPSAPSRSQDREILAYMLGLELIEVAFYERALARLPLRGELEQFCRTVVEHERAHAAELTRVLGGAPNTELSVDLDRMTADVDAFRATSAALEDVVAGAYAGAATNLTAGALGTVVRIASVEARHAAWASGLHGDVPAPEGTERLLDAPAARSRLETLGTGSGP